MRRLLPAVFLVMLAHSIGWGIRGNFGHEYGAMIAGALSAIAIVVVSGREDWRVRLPCIAMFGAIGWGFGGSIAYMPVISYTHSGHLPTQIYGFFAIFVVGFLWTAMGAAGTAWAAIEEREKLTALFRPLCWVFVFWAAWDIATAAMERGDFRQRDPFYWLDSDWVQAWLAVAALFLFDLWDRRFRAVHWLLICAGVGAGAGYLAQRALAASGAWAVIAPVLVRPQGDVSRFAAADLITNWPLLFFDIAPYMGALVGLLAGAALYFARWGEFRSGSGLLLKMALGGFAVFFIGPVLLGIRLTPPRGDNWAMCVGITAAVVIHFARRGLPEVSRAALTAGVLGGLAFMVAQFVKVLCLMPGNPALTSDAAAVARWAHWRSANWHSLVTEQGVGLLYGLSVAITMGVVATQAKPRIDEPRARRWTDAFAVLFILNLLTYLNLVKNTGTWVKQAGVAAWMKAPLFGFVQFSANGWFNLAWLAFGICSLAVILLHKRRPVALIPGSRLGRAQLLFLAFLWTMVIGNFERALPGFREQRLVTEGLIFLNALAATFLVLYAPVGLPEFRAPLRAALAVPVLIVVFAGVVHGVYGNRHDGWGGRNIRFGPEADWRVRPLLKSVQHR